MRAVRKVKNLKYTDRTGETQNIKNAIVLDLTKGIPLKKLIEQAIKISESATGAERR